MKEKENKTIKYDSLFFCTRIYTNVQYVQTSIHWASARARGETAQERNERKKRKKKRVSRVQVSARGLGHAEDPQERVRSVHAHFVAHHAVGAADQPAHGQALLR